LSFFTFFSGGATTLGVAHFEQAFAGRRKLVFGSTANACSKFEDRNGIVKFLWGVFPTRTARKKGKKSDYFPRHWNSDLLQK